MSENMRLWVTEMARRREERRQGGATQVMRFSSGRGASQMLAHAALLPCVASTATLQDSSGAFYNLPGYSKSGGPDVGS